MSYESNLDRKSGKLLNPAQLCLLLSVALHLLVLKYGLPTIRLNDKGGRREVSVIELNPEQQARLPDLYPQLNTPNVPEINDLPPLDNSPPAAPFAIPESLIPGLGDSSNLPPLVIPPPPNFDNLPPLPPITDITLPPIGDVSNLPLPPEINPEDFKPDSTQLPPPTTDKPEQPPTPGVKPEDKPVKPPTNKPETKPEEQPQAQPKPTPEQIAKKKATDSQQRISKLSQSLKKDTAGTTDEEARKNYIAWLTKVQDIKPNSIEVKGTYPRDACIRRLKGTSVYGVVVDGSGKVVALDPIKGAEYPIFNEQASKEIAQSILENDTGKPKPYQVTVNYEYDPEICPSLTLPSIRRKEEQESEKSAPIPPPASKPETKPAPEAEPASKPETKPAPEAEPELKPAPEPEPSPEAEPASKPEPKPLPSLRERLRDIPLPDRKPADLKDIPLLDRNPADLKDIPLPDKPNFKK